MYNRKQVFVAACLGMLSFGVAITTLGAILPPLSAAFGMDKASAGSLFLLMSGGILAGSLVFGPVVDRYGYKRLLLVCIALIAAGLEGIAFASGLAFLRGAVFLIGLGSGMINGATNALVADISPEERSADLSLLGVFFGLGAFGMPFALGLLLDFFAYDTLIAGLGAILFLPFVFFTAIRFPAPKQAQGFPLGEGLRLLREPLVLLMGFLLFLQSGIEITVGGWTTTYFTEELALAPGDAVFYLSLFWVGLTLARLALGTVLKRIPPVRVLQGCIGIALAGSVLLLASRSLLLATPGIFLIGAGLAAGFPVLLGYAGDRYPRLSGTVFGILLVMALTGGSLMPYLAGIFGEAFGLRASFALIPASLLLMGLFLTFALAPRLARAAPAAPSSP